MTMKDQSNSKEDMLKQIVLERLRQTSPNFKVALGSKEGFLHKEQLINEVSKNTDLGRKIIDIQRKYLESLKEGIV